MYALLAFIISGECSSNPICLVTFPHLSHPSCLSQSSRQRLVVCFFNAFLLALAYFSKHRAMNDKAPPLLDTVLIKHQKRQALVPTETVCLIQMDNMHA